MSVPFEKELENVAREIAIYPDEPKTPKEVLAVLRERLLPLLEAGQAMRDTAPGTDFDRLASEWDAARERLAQLEKR